jgi:ubiquinone/menaquinone biosynthesis C-methylase UbiE
MSSPFDILAENYDRDFTSTAIGQLQRKQVWTLLYQVLNTYHKPARILEINCGTGEDALQLAKLGHSVVATDASEVMIKKATQKAALSAAGIQFLVCPFEDLSRHFSEERFDLVISNFGGLNCISETALTRLSEELSAMLCPEGKLFMVVMSRSCLWETLYHSLKGNINTAFRRQRRSVVFRAGTFSMPVYYYSPRVLKRIFAHSYQHLRTRAVGFFVPPSYLEQQFLNRKHWLSWLSSLEQKWNRYAVLAGFADHFCIMFEKKES